MHAHARRYFEKALDHDQKRATYALSVIQSLYAIEREVKVAVITHPERVSKSRSHPGAVEAVAGYAAAKCSA
ncbi:MAG: transposase [Bacteroidota bacterium]